MKKLVTAILALVMVFACIPLAACKKVQGEQVDKNRTQLYVGIYEGGWGREWIDLMKVEFEKQYPSIQIMIEGKKSEFQNTTLLASIAANQQDMYFTTVSPYEAVAQETNNNKLLDVTDIVTTPIKDLLADAADPSAFANETKTIEQKMDPFLQTYMKAASKEKNKYFTIPFYTSFYNIVYDVELFEEGGYFIAANEGGNITWTTGAEGAPAKWAGQDGLTGTYDDGLPISYYEFCQLCAKLDADGVSPLMWGADMSGYREDYLTTVWANYVGADEYKLGFTLDGQSSELGVTINQDNGFELQKSNGKRAALTMAKTIANQTWYDTEANRADYLEAQRVFVSSKIKASQGGKRVAMLIEGGWWENECKAYRENLASQFGDEYKERRFGVMTVPRFDAATASEVPAQTNNSKVLYSVTTNSCVFIKKNTTKADIAKKFMAFTTTDAMLRLYNRVTGSTRAYDYELTDEDLAQMSYYKRNIWDIFNTDTTELVYSHGPSQMAMLNQAYFRSQWNWSANDTNRSYSDPIQFYKDYPDLSVQVYMDALYNTHKDGWASKKAAAGIA